MKGEATLDSGLLPPKLCRCEKNPAQPSHTCPFKEEINSSLDECECCNECTYECAMDI